MILDQIDQISQYYQTFPLLKEVASFLSNQHLNPIQLAEKTRITDDVFVIPISAKQSADAKATLEAHKTWIDVHYTVKGTDTIVFKSVNDCNVVDTPYQEADDYMLFKDAFEGELTVPQGYFCLITPNMAHMAMCGNDDITKLVFKLRFSPN